MKKDKNYKIIVSILFGILGFLINLIPLTYNTNPFSISFLIGLLFPLLITLAWGWKYGALSATLGLGTQSMWISWDLNWYYKFLIIPFFTFWVIWHGLFIHEFRKNKKWYFSPYFIEIIFRGLNIIAILIFVNTFADLSIFHIQKVEVHSSEIAVILLLNDIVNGFFILLLADILLNIKYIRNIFGLHSLHNQNNIMYAINRAFLLGAIYWIIDSLYVFFYYTQNQNQTYIENISFLEALFLDIPAYSFFARMTFLAFCLMGGLIIASDLIREKELKTKINNLIYGNPIPTYAIDQDGRLTHWNMEMEKLFKIKDSKIINTKKHLQIFKEKGIPIMANMIVNKADEYEFKKHYKGSLKKQNESYIGEDYYPRIGKSGKWIRVIAYPIRDLEGKITGALGKLEDISEFKEKIKETEKINKILVQREKKIIEMKQKLDICLKKKT